MRSTKTREFVRSHVLGLVAIFIALTGTAVAGQSSGGGDGPKASASVVTDAKFKKLKKRVAALEAKPAPVIPTIPTTLPPSGPAGGVLTGTYPNPGLGADTVGAAQIIDGSVGSAELVDGGVGSADLGLDSVGSEELKANRATTSAGFAMAANTATTGTVSCDPGEALLGGGHATAIDNNTANVFVNVSAPTQNPPDSVTGWTVVAESAVANTLFVWAICVDV